MKSPELKLSVECGELHPMGSCPCCGELREHMEAATWFDVEGKACVILSCRWCGSTYFRETLDGLSGKSPRAGSTNNMKTPTEKQPTKSPDTPAARGSMQRLVRPPNPPALLQKEWWAPHDGDAIRVTGYSCEPSNPEMWWCPQIGYSCSEGHSIFETEEEALRKALAEAEREAAKWAEIVNRLNARMPNDKVSHPERAHK